jgi:hypothetical protein
MFEGGEQALHHGVIPSAPLGRHAASDSVGSQQFAVGGGPVLAALIGMDQQLLGFQLALPQGPVEGLQYQRRLHRGTQAPADDTQAEQIHPHRQIAPPGCGADVGDVTGPATVRGRWGEVLLEQVLCYASSTAGSAAGPEAPASLSAQAGSAPLSGVTQAVL